MIVFRKCLQLMTPGEPKLKVDILKMTLVGKLTNPMLMYITIFSCTTFTKFEVCSLSECTVAKDNTRTIVLYLEIYIFLQAMFAY